MWLFLLRSAMEIASSSLPSRNAPATCCTNTRDCLRAALYISTRSIMTPSDHAERRKRIPTTAFAIILILPHIVLRSHWPCRMIRFIAATDRFASMSFAPFYFVQDLFRSRFYKTLAGTTFRRSGRLPDWRFDSLSGLHQTHGARSPSNRHPALTTHRKCYGNRRIHFDRIAVQLRGLIAPLLHRVQRGLHQQRMPGHHFELRDFAFLIDDRVENHVALNTRLPCQCGINGTRLRDDRRRRYLSALLDARWRGRLGRRRKRRPGIPDESLTRNSAEHAALVLVVNHIRGKFGFLKYGHFLRNRARLHQLAGLDQAGHRLDDNLFGCGRRRWGRRRRRCDC